MEKMNFVITPEEAGMRVDKCLAVRLGEEYSRSFVKTLMDKGLVLVDGNAVKPRYLLQEHENIDITLPDVEKSELKPEDIPLNIVHEDEWIVVVDKPSGIIVHPGAGNKSGTLVNALLFHSGKLPLASDEVRPGIVHRLDKDTTGLIVVAKNDKALRSLAKQFHDRNVKKNYIALVRGNVESDNGKIDAPINRSEVFRKKMAVDYGKGKEAVTIFHVLKRFDRFSVLRLELMTGRTHQIRVHLKHIGHPVLGDPAYGYGNETSRQALHAEKLAFTHPGTGEFVEFFSPVPDDMMEVIDRGDFVDPNN